jgi:PadR family transcriptional regulator PadR
MGKPSDQLQGTLELLVLRTLASAGERLHGFGIAERIQHVSAEALRVEEGSLYPALHRMNEEGWVQSEWGTSDNNRRARFYRITTKGRRRLTQLERDWAKHVAAVKRVIRHA